MRLWHEKLIPYLPRQQLLGQHRECCALRGNGWGKPHSVVNYVFKYNRVKLVLYHMLVMKEMQRRGFDVDPVWFDYGYRGKRCIQDSVEQVAEMLCDCEMDFVFRPIYSEHNKEYLAECVSNLAGKGIYIEVDKINWR